MIPHVFLPHLPAQLIHPAERVSPQIIAAGALTPVNASMVHLPVRMMDYVREEIGAGLAVLLRPQYAYPGQLAISALLLAAVCSASCPHPHPCGFPARRRGRMGTTTLSFFLEFGIIYHHYEVYTVARLEK